MALHDHNKNGKSISITAAEKVNELVTVKSVNDEFYNILANKERFHKATTMVQLYEAIGKQRIEVRKLKPDVSHFDEEGKLISEHYSKSQMESLKKARERLQKMENAFTKSFENGEYKDVFELVQQLGSKDKGGGSKESSGEAA